jgi:hypothetical protein
MGRWFKLTDEFFRLVYGGTSTTSFLHRYRTFRANLLTKVGRGLEVNYEV